MNMLFVENILFKYVPKLKCNIHSQYVRVTKYFQSGFPQRYIFIFYALLLSLFFSYEENLSLSR